MKGHKPIKSAMAKLKEVYPDTELTEYCLRRLCKDGRVDSFPSGNKIYVNMKSLDKFLNGDSDEK